MAKRKVHFFITIMCFVFFVEITALLILMRDEDQQTEETTALYTATVTDVKIVNVDEDVSVRIFVKEYDTYLLITSDIVQNISMDDVKRLGEGQTIIFRIENYKVPNMGYVAFVDISSLSTETTDIFTLEEHNQYTQESLFIPRIAGGVIAALLLYAAIVNLLKIRKKHPATSSTD